MVRSREGGRLQPGRLHAPQDRPRQIEEPQPTGPWFEAECKWFSGPKGHGMLTAVGGSEDIFLHMDTLRRASMRELTPGQRVQIRAGRTDRGLMVTAIRIVQHA